MTATIHDTSQAYGSVSVVLHWAVAILVLLLLVTATMMAVWLPDRTASPLLTPFGALDRTTLVLTHEALGLFLIPAAILRTVWRYRSGKPVAPVQHKSLAILASVVWRCLLIGILIQIISGPLALFFYGYPLQFFSVDVVPSPFAASEAWHAVTESVHHFTGWVICAVVFLHIGGALYHALLKKDGTLGRMLIPGRVLRENQGRGALGGKAGA